MRIRMVLLLGVIALVLSSTSAMAAFHEAGGLKCEQCHIMHAQEDGTAVTVAATSKLQRKADSGVCLDCHDEAIDTVAYTGGVTVPKVLNSDQDDTVTNILAGGEFGDDYDSGTSMQSSGHLIGVASTASGAISTTLQCISCHDPHFSSNYRMLKTLPTGATDLSTDMTLATGGFIEDSGYEYTGKSATVHNVYGADTADWCGQCHTDPHQGAYTPGTSTKHPTEDYLDGIASTSVYAVGGAASYDPDVPLQGATTATGIVLDGTTAGTDHQIMCLSCHRAHGGDGSDTAGAGNDDTHLSNGLRWDITAATAADNDCNICHDK